MMPSDPGAATTARRRRDGDGQVLPLFVLSVFVIIGMVAVVVDVAWFWTNSSRCSSAADAGALAGAVYLPGDVPRAYSSATRRGEEERLREWRRVALPSPPLRTPATDGASR